MGHFTEQIFILDLRFLLVCHFMLTFAKTYNIDDEKTYMAPCPGGLPLLGMR